jgi:hypothetical protein
VESFDLRASNQYVLVGVIAFCENMFVPGKSQTMAGSLSVSTIAVLSTKFLW